MSEVVPTQPIYSDDALAAIKSWDDAINTLKDAGVAVTEIADYGDGFSVVDKKELIGVPFIILDYKFADGDFGNNFAVVRCVTKDDRKVIITDGSGKSGIRPQVLDLQRRGVPGGVMVPNGLTASDYKYTDEATGQEKPARTYYFSQ